MKLKRLQSFHNSMRLYKTSVGTFDFEFNKVQCACLFEADYKKGFSITFFKKITAENISLPILPGYNISTYIKPRELFIDFWSFFGFEKGNGTSHMTNFFKTFEATIPTTFSPKKNIKREVIVKKYNLEERDKPYFQGFVNWSIHNAKYPDKPRHRNPENLEKTKLLYPEIYEAIKEHDISVRYTAFEQVVDIQQLLDETLGG